MKSAVSWDTYHKYQASFKILHTVPLSKSMHSCVQECPDKSKMIDSTPLLEQKFFFILQNEEIVTEESELTWGLAFSTCLFFYVLKTEQWPQSWDSLKSPSKIWSRFIVDNTTAEFRWLHFMQQLW